VAPAENDDTGTTLSSHLEAGEQFSGVAPGSGLTFSCARGLCVKTFGLDVSVGCGGADALAVPFTSGSINMSR
jgi:hypothetical protein